MKLECVLSPFSATEHEKTMGLLRIPDPRLGHQRSE